MLPSGGSFFDDEPPLDEHRTVPRSKSKGARSPGRPPKPPRTAFSVRLPSDLYESFSLGAWAQDKAMAEIIEELVQAWVANHADVIEQGRALREAASKRDRK